MGQGPLRKPVLFIATPWPLPGPAYAGSPGLHQSLSPAFYSCSAPLPHSVSSLLASSMCIFWPCLSPPSCLAYPTSPCPLAPLCLPGLRWPQLFGCESPSLLPRFHMTELLQRFHTLDSCPLPLLPEACIRPFFPPKSPICSLMQVPPAIYQHIIVLPP